MEVTIDLPSKVLESIEKASYSEGKTVEEFIATLVYKYIKLLDPQLKSELHLKLCDKYLREAEKLLGERNYVQASEKAWRAASQIVKAIAAGRGLELKSHRELHRFVSNLRKESGDAELNTLWSSATSLHQNFYENWLPPEMVKDYMENVKKFIGKTRRELRNK